ncbi:hypothetical protein ACFOPX_01630 [Helicobacter baculiformis]|uniref:Uncharacterized protein n=1 Tax=Helicobacter baculiformis TaxID=427351 RepID=A0ABV7ZGU3_9HELI|nr:hypothetical protein [Helicobacter baculiformis]
MEGLETKRGKYPGQHESKRKFNQALIREAILGLGSSGGRHSYMAYYRYYLELERAHNPHFKGHYTKFVNWAHRLIATDMTLQSVLINASMPKCPQDIINAISRA